MIFCDEQLSSCWRTNKSKFSLEATAALHMFDCLDHRTSSGSGERRDCNIALRIKLNSHPTVSVTDNCQFLGGEIKVGTTLLTRCSAHIKDFPNSLSLPGCSEGTRQGKLSQVLPALLHQYVPLPSPSSLNNPDTTSTPVPLAALLGTPRLPEMDEFPEKKL